MTPDAVPPPGEHESAKHETALPDSQAEPSLNSSEQSDARARTGLLASPWRLLFQIGSESRTTVGLEVKSRLVLGRADPVAGFQPDLDLSPYGGQEGGVSRRHALVVRDDANRSLYLEDLNSTNGTRINGFPLEPRRRYRLRDGDELELGQVKIVLRFSRSPYG